MILMNDLERRFNKLRHFNATLETSSDKDVGNITLEKRKVKEDTTELVANQIYDKIAKLFNERRRRRKGFSSGFGGGRMCF